MINWLENWYLNMCDGDWEHDYGITIKTLDNPGWDLTIDLINTGIEFNDEKWNLVEKSETDWYGYKVTNNVFNASGDPQKLNFIISLFKEKIEQHKS
jgi:hypothetical protein